MKGCASKGSKGPIFTWTRDLSYIASALLALVKKRNVESFCKNVSYNVVILPNRMQI